jgi:hypothetical protein
VLYGFKFNKLIPNPKHKQVISFIKSCIRKVKLGKIRDLSLELYNCINVLIAEI